MISGISSVYGMAQDDGKLSLHNHLRFTILYHRDIETDLSRIVGFEVKHFSVQHKYDGTWNPDKPDLTTCSPGSMKSVSDKDDPQEIKEGKEVIFTYDVVYEVSSAKHETKPHKCQQQLSRIADCAIAECTASIASHTDLPI